MRQCGATGMSYRAGRYTTVAFIVHLDLKSLKLSCDLPECILAFEDIAVALSSLLAAEADVVGLAYESMMPYLVFNGVLYHEIIAVLQCDCAIEIREENELWVLEWLVHGLEIGNRCGPHLED